jgi:hypothetical protein
MERADMKNSDGQLYTIEGFAAALIMIATAYLVINATSVYTAGDTHISDMQLEALGTDALKVMDIPVSNDEPSMMQEIINATPPSGGNNLAFGTNFSYLINNKTGQNSDHIQFSATYTCRNSDDSTASIPLSFSRNLSGGEHAVRVTKWVIVNKAVCDLPATKPRVVLVEVLMWRD